LFFTGDSGNHFASEHARASEEGAESSYTRKLSGLSAQVVSSAQRQDDLFTFQFREKPREARRQRRSASAFDHRFLQFHQSQDRQRNVVFIDENDSLKKV
jgi:hypothetical protein